MREYKGKKVTNNDMMVIKLDKTNSAEFMNRSDYIMHMIETKGKTSHRCDALYRDRP